jgi:hypothetical protein
MKQTEHGQFFPDVPIDDFSVKKAAVDLVAAFDDKWELLEHRMLRMKMMLNLIHERNEKTSFNDVMTEKYEQ